MLKTLKRLLRIPVSLAIRTGDQLVLRNKVRNLSDGNHFFSPLPSYHSQYAANDNWKAEGWKNYQEYQYWAPRICPIACLKMLLGNSENSPSISQLTNEGLELNGYDIARDEGWFHFPLVKLVQKHGLEAKVIKYLSLSRIVYELSQNHAVIASVDARKLNYLLKNDEKTAGYLEPTINHMVSVIGFRQEKGNCAGLYLFNPSYPNPKNKDQPFYIEIKNFLPLFNHRGITVSLTSSV